MRGQSLLQGAAPKLLSSRLFGRRNQQPGIGFSRFCRAGLPFAASPPVGGTEYACSCCQDALPRSIGRRHFSSSSTSNEAQHERLSQGIEGSAPANPSRRRTSVAAPADPTAKRPTAKCDPYGQGGKPMDAAQAKMLLSTVHADWRVISKGVSLNDRGREPSVSTLHHDGENDVRDLPSIEDNTDDDHDGGDGVALYLVREFRHPDFVSAGRFAAVLAAVAELQAHYPRQLVTERRVVKKSWVVTTTVICQTQVLGGLSINDFHLAMMMDVEVERPEVRKLLLPMR